MINKESIEGIIAEVISKSDIFLVDVKVSNDNKISVLIDTFEGITIQQCGNVSRQIENHLDRDTEDFSLEVSSPGLSFPLKHLIQYKKNINRDVEIVTMENKKLKGTLLAVDENGITIEHEIKVKEEGRKKKTKKREQLNLLFDTIKTTKVLPDFKRLNRM